MNGLKGDARLKVSSQPIGETSVEMAESDLRTTKTGKSTMNKLQIAISSILLILSSASVNAEGSDWYPVTDGEGTPFESRWANVEPDWERSSGGTMMAAAGISGQDGNLNLYVIHPRPALEAITSEFTGTKDNCTHDNWRLAIDKQEFHIEETSLSTDSEATFIEPEYADSFWQAFLDGRWLAVQVERDCDGDVTRVTLVYSLRGSRLAADHVLGN